MQFGKQRRQNRFKSGGTNNLRTKRAEKFFELLYKQNCRINFKNFQHLGGFQPATPHS